MDHTLRRKAAVQAGDTNPADAFDPAVQWDGFPVDTVDGLGAYGDALPPDDAPTVTAVSPTAGSIVAVGSQVTVTFSEDVAAPASAFALSCNGAPVAFALSGGPTTFTLDPTADLPFGASCSATVTGASVSDTDTNDPPDTVAADRTWTFSTAQDVDRCALPATTIGSLQGSGDDDAGPRRDADRPWRRRRRPRGPVARRCAASTSRTPVTGTPPPPTRCSSSTAATRTSSPSATSCR